MKTILGIVLILCAFHHNASAKAYFQTKREMIERADVIAVITISTVQETDTKGRTWTYRQKGTAKIEKILKGKISSDFTIYGSETFICAQCPISAGRFLVFLKKDELLWTGSNWHLSLRPIKGINVEWFVDEKNRYDMKPLALSKVLEEIKTIISNKSE